MKIKKRILCGLLATILGILSSARAHDIWLESNTNIVRVGDIAYVNLMLGNHGNGHRDFKIAGKVNAEDATLQLIAPGGARYDLKSRLIDSGYSPEEGFWTAKVNASKAGIYQTVATFDKVMSYAPVRDIKSAKTFFLATSNIQRVPIVNSGFNRVLGHSLELVPQTNPVAPLGPGTNFRVKLLWKGKPLAKTKIAFIPRGETLKPGFDARYERTTNAQGIASFEPKTSGYYLVAAHQKTTERGQGYNATNYSATLVLFVPQICPCCG